MITVSATDLLRVVDATLTQKVEPSLGNVDGRSALATVRHLLNFVRMRIEREGQMLLDDIFVLKPLLARTAAFLRAAGAVAEASAIEMELSRVPDPDPRHYRSLDDLAVDAGVLREALHGALGILQGMRTDHGEKADYANLRSDIRHYLVRQIEAEGEIVGPSFFGKGPRR